MKRFLILLLAVLVALTVLGCKIKQDKALDDMEKTAKQMTDQMNDINKKVDSNSQDVSKKRVDINESADAWLDTYERIVVSYEKKADKGALTSLDMLYINAKLSELSQKSESAKTWTAEQANKLGKLSARLTAVVGKYKP